jgi:hypothetical protein
VKRIIFSLYRNDLDDHASVPDFKRQQFYKYADQLENKQKEYADLCGADYKIFKPNSTDYIDVQFEKLNMFEKLGHKYDQVMYLDFDVIPNTTVNIFDRFDLNTICSFDIDVIGDTRKVLRWRLEDDFEWNSMDMYSKAINKQAMLLLHDIVGKQSCINTGVLLMNSKCIRNLNFAERSVEAVLTFNEALEDNVYPEKMSKNWVLNNEVIFSYIVEKYGLPFTNIGMPWNFIVDHNEQQMTSASHFLHFVHKKFDLFFG